MLLGTNNLQNYLEAQSEEIYEWFEAKLNYLKRDSLPLPLYSSFDIRDSGNKTSVVDSNIFPSGFNNLDLNSQNFASKQFSKYLSLTSEKKNILLVPENHTRNKFYFSNFNVLSQILNKGGFKTYFGFIEGSESPDSIYVLDNEGQKLKIEKIFRNEDRIYTESFQDGIIILNNDLSLKKPVILEQINQQVLPPISLGWYNRKKSTHFQFYNKLVDELASLTSFDPWLLRTFFTHIEKVDFKNKNSLDDVADAVDKISEKVAQKYAEYNISDSPIVFIKNNSGTYGLGIITVSSGEEIRNLNSKNRKKMIYGKQGARINSVLIQEGIPTTFFVDNHPAEPVIYNVGGEIVGGFMRINTKADNSKNLNKNGMFFKKLVENDMTRPIILKDGNFSLYSMITNIASLAIAYEYKQSMSKS
jgi:glutamate--cysteine ligase